MASSHFVTSSLCLLCACTLAVSNRGGIAVATYSEMLSMPLTLSKPLIITNSPMSNWTLYENLLNIYEDDYKIECKQQITNCSCFEEELQSKHDTVDTHTICQELASTFLYTGNNQNNYAHWLPFERWRTTSNLSLATNKCLNVSFGSIQMKDAYNIINSSSITLKSFNNQIKSVDKLNQRIYDRSNNQYTKFYSYSRVFSTANAQSQALYDNDMDADADNADDEQYIDSILEHIDLSAFFGLFEIDDIDKIIDIHIWFGLHYYQAIRHYDKPNNLFFVLKGSRKFKLSLPTACVFPLYPIAHQSYRHEFIYYNNSNNLKESYPIHEVDVYENELLYLPGYWHHQVENNNFSFALSMWFKSADQSHAKQIIEYKLPINPASDTMRMDYINEFLYFIQNLVEKWCQKITTQFQGYDAHLKCLEYVEVGGVDGFLLAKYKKIYPLLDDLSYDTLEWYGIGLDIEDILKCMTARIEDCARTISEFKEHLNACFMFEDKYQKMWDKAIVDIIDLHLQYSNIGIADVQFVDYIEVLMLTLFEDVNVLPVWIAFMRL